MAFIGVPVLAASAQATGHARAAGEGPALQPTAELLWAQAQANAVLDGTGQGIFEDDLPALPVLPEEEGTEQAGASAETPPAEAPPAETDDGTPMPDSRFVAPVPGPITGRFGPRFHPILHYVRNHNGVDMTAACGTPVVAMGDGRVTRSGRAGGYGNLVELTHGKVDGSHMSSRYAHLSVLGVQVGQQVKKGQQIGLAGTTGLSTGCHLHFEVLANGSFVDPAAVLSGAPHARLNIPMTPVVSPQPIPGVPQTTTPRPSAPSSQSPTPGATTPAPGAAADRPTPPAGPTPSSPGTSTPSAPGTTAPTAKPTADSSPSVRQGPSNGPVKPKPETSSTSPSESDSPAPSPSTPPTRTQAPTATKAPTAKPTAKPTAAPSSAAPEPAPTKTAAPASSAAPAPKPAATEAAAPSPDTAAA